MLLTELAMARGCAQFLAAHEPGLAWRLLTACENAHSFSAEGQASSADLRLDADDAVLIGWRHVVVGEMHNDYDDLRTNLHALHGSQARHRVDGRSPRTGRQISKGTKRCRAAPTPRCLRLITSARLLSSAATS
ncbi:hypothetical protein [Actinokineospora sp.]|uniref:hypothetical protein n=1 Tax=Actinokineospora sp. TaxID=1872133 RepID=UPI003D6C0ED8